MISMCEVRIEYKPQTKREYVHTAATAVITPSPLVAVISRPLPPIYHPGSLVDMVFYCPPPARSASSSGSGKPDSKTAASNIRTLYLAVTAFDADDCECSLPMIYAHTNTFHIVRHVSTQVRDCVIHVPCPW